MTAGAAARHLRRRAILAGALAVPFAAARAAPAATDRPESLGGLARRKGLLFGTACRYEHVAYDPAYAALLARECRVIVAQDDLKWAPLRPSPDRFDFSRADAVVAFAESIGARMRGHALVWHETLPDWFDKQLDARAARALLSGHIATVCGRYRGRMQSWDVVNEAVELDDGRADGLRETPWLRALGPGYVGEAFGMAAAADPSAMLVYNDYGICDDGRKSRAKRAAVLRLLDRLLATGAPVQALGLQAHLTAGMAFNERELHGFLDEVESRGLKVMVTEMDVLDEAASGDPAGQDGRVADAYAKFLNIVLSHPAMVACITWGLSDRYSWLRFVTRRKPIGDLRPLPYDENYRPKPARSAIAEAVARLPDIA